MRPKLLSVLLPEALPNSAVWLGRLEIGHFQAAKLASKGSKSLAKAEIGLISWSHTETIDPAEGSWPRLSSVDFATFSAPAGGALTSLN
ncbi:MAG: hypothetical protein AAGG44_04620 [Planctomycetota bacterium]